MPTSRKKKAPEEPKAPKAPEEPKALKAPEETKAPKAPVLNEPDDYEDGPKVVSLNRELSTIALAVRGGQMMADLEAACGYLDEDQEYDAPSCISSVLAIVGARMDLLGQVVRQEVNPAILWGPHNSVRSGESRIEGDILLVEWNPS